MTKATKIRLIIIAIPSFFILINCLVIWNYLQPSPLPDNVKIDKVVVYKSQRVMKLMAGNKAIQTYRIALGGEPKGHKQCEGDQRTPEGVYTLDYRIPNSAFFMSYHISYPNEQDIEAARENGCNPGGMIMIHGLPEHWAFIRNFHRFMNWTDGCIAITNPEMKQFWDAVPVGTSIEIYP